MLKQIADLPDDIERMLAPPPPVRCFVCNDHPKTAITPRDCPSCGNPLDEFAQPVKAPNFYETHTDE